MIHTAPLGLRQGLAPQEKKLDLRPFDELAMRPIDAMTKGYPADAPETPLGDIRNRCWSLLRGDLPMPVAVLRQSILDNNRRWMRAFVALSGVHLSPHGKTSMSPQLARLQLEDGAWAITCATSGQLEVYRRFGVRRIILANQLVGRSNLRSALRHLHDPEFEIFVIVDSVEGVDALARTARDLDLPQPVQALIEVGAPSGRTGVRSMSDAIDVADKIADSGGSVALVGVETYESVFHSFPRDEARRRIEDLLATTVRVVQGLDDGGRFKPGTDIIVSAGGSDYFDIAINHLSNLTLSQPYRLVLRSGCYISGDSFYYREAFVAIRDREPSLAKLDQIGRAHV